jgi:hypothetical protein
MKQILALPIVALAVLALRPVGDPLPIGASIPNPEVKMKDISGMEVSFKDAQKKNGLLVMFSCNTCPVVKKISVPGPWRFANMPSEMISALFC